MRYRTFGRTGWKVSEIGVGTWAMGGMWGPLDDAEATRALRKAIELGTGVALVTVEPEVIGAQGVEGDQDHVPRSRADGPRVGCVGPSEPEHQCQRHGDGEASPPHSSSSPGSVTPSGWGRSMDRGVAAIQSARKATRAWDRTLRRSG